MGVDKESRQLEILRFIHKKVGKSGYPPTVREICDAVDLSSTSTVHGHLSRLAKNGFIQRDPTKPRALEVTAAGLKALGIKPTSIPLLGTVAAGEPILAYEYAEDFYPVPPHLERESADLFMLRISGDSMINAGILDDDLIVVRRQSTANNGDIVVAMTEDDGATCKRFYKESDHIRLEPENDRLSAILLSNVTILGKVVSLYREFV